VVSYRSRALADNDAELAYVLCEMVVLVRTHVKDRSGRIGLVRGKRTVRVTAYMLFHLPAKDLCHAVVNHVN